MTVTGGEPVSTADLKEAAGSIGEDIAALDSAVQTLEQYVENPYREVLYAGPPQQDVGIVLENKSDFDRYEVGFTSGDNGAYFGSVDAATGQPSIDGKRFSISYDGTPAWKCTFHWGNSSYGFQRIVGLRKRTGGGQLVADALRRLLREVA